MTEIGATAIQNAEGLQAVRTECRDCGTRLTLPCRGEDGKWFDLAGMAEHWQTFALKWADMVICTRCDEIREQQRLEREMREQLGLRVREAQIPKTFQDLKFDDMDAAGERSAAISAAWAWADTPPGHTAGVLLYGPAGTGKSRLAATASWQRLQRYRMTWCSVAHLFASLQASFTDQDRRQALQVLTGAGALVLDDLDKVKPSEWALSHLFVAIDRRVSAGSPLFVTSNAPPEQLTEKFGSAVTSRLLGYCQVFEFSGRDRRTTGGGQ